MSNQAQTISFTVPLVPPSVNHYVKHTRMGRHYKTCAALVWVNAVSSVVPRDLRLRLHGDLTVEAVIYLGAKQKGDVDNFGKVICDSLVSSGVIDSDSAITDLTLRKRRDRENPRTEISVTVL